MIVKSTPDVGIVTLAGTLASLVFGPEAAIYIGPYVVILLASTVGASFALSRRVRTGRSSALWFFLRTNALAIMLTVGVAGAISSYTPWLPERVLIAPVAFFVGFVGDDWPSIFTWLGGKLNAIVDILIKLKGGGS
jgi:hypothetical protein